MRGKFHILFLTMILKTARKFAIYRGRKLLSRITVLPSGEENQGKASKA